MVRWYNGATVRWYNGTKVKRYYGVKAQVIEHWCSKRYCRLRIKELENIQMFIVDLISS